MKVETQVNGTVFQARISDRLAFSDHAAFRSLLKEIDQTGAKDCVLDLSGLAMIDSSGLGMLMIAFQEGKKNGWSLTIRSPQGHVESLLKLAKFDKILTIQP
ncbi:MAG: STAS domain-containing protein [Xanthobacteraceae bacterium]|jgi:anti-anti-sigma factor